MNQTTTLEAEWERIDVLTACLSLTRQGETIPDSMQSRLKDLQNQVLALREQPPWHGLVEERTLSTLDQDILACALAPVAEPRLGWAFQQLQPGISTAYPTPALMQELYFMNQQDSVDLYTRLSTGAPLLRYGLVESSPKEPYSPIRPTQRANTALLGWAKVAGSAPPGTVEITDEGTWEDLVLPPYCLQALEEFLLWTTHREQVFGEWGGKPIGGPVALFAGPSGTGKTFSAVVLANALGWPLYRVDLGMLVSKYIGETEKNFNALFDAAHGQSMVLLFDEAESLFGKRGEVRDVRDRFANMEISHLLSRIERHQGPCILTTNLRQHLDHAFARRFQVVLEYPRPDAAARAVLWRKHLPPRAPFENDVDVECLGTELKLTGGQIRNTALCAAFLAAGEGRPIGLNHIARAVRTEFGKGGKEVVISSLGNLADYLNQDAAHVAH